MNSIDLIGAESGRDAELVGRSGSGQGHGRKSLEVYSKLAITDAQQGYNEYPKTKKLTSPGENVHFFVLGCYKILKLMGIMGVPSYISKIKKNPIFGFFFATDKWGYVN
ncbi:hypothetical protein COM13_24200 [Bacillus pseudomycoides]|nr:hypothetical protein COO07_29760 [Bacillus pseudomycoides]PEK77955.1 hypothetical protein CN597_17530 [Bacillus pseudomycoides]PEN05709.1 hypothetical protein CN640_20085 [Bacillus pseudomycoides]PGB81022.1 hypothetical protein COM13_24200 [Bacillus pseudomycoides]PHE52739.1 hypothetical protein COF52_28870 [Bacillus pseudomycoides]